MLGSLRFENFFFEKYAGLPERTRCPLRIFEPDTPQSLNILFSRINWEAVFEGHSQNSFTASLYTHGSSVPWPSGCNTCVFNGKIIFSICERLVVARLF